MMYKKIISSFKSLAATAYVLLAFVSISEQAEAQFYCNGPFGGAGAIGDPARWTFIGNPGNASDPTTGYGAVSYNYSYFDRFVRIDDYVTFLNAVDPSNNKNFEGLLVDFGVIEYSGGLWRTKAWSDCSPFTGQSMTATQVGKLAVTYISFNQACRFANWVATGNINSGAYTFSSTTNGNASVTSVNLSFSGVRLPTENEFYKAAYYRASNSTYVTYGTTTLDGSGEPLRATVSSTGMLSPSNGHAYDLPMQLFVLPGSLHCLWQVQSGQGGKSYYGIYNMVGGFHHYLTNGGSPSMILRPQNQIQGGAAEQSRNYRNNAADPAEFYASPSFHLVVAGNSCGSSCVNPTATAAATQPTCTGTNAPNNGRITISGFTTGQRYQYSPGTTFNSGTAVPAAITTIPAGGVITTTLTNTTQSYTVRIYTSADNACFVDRTINITAASCCTPPTITSVTSTQPNCTVAIGSITIVATTGSGTLEYSINNGTSWQASGSFSGLVPGNYTVKIRNAVSCETVYTSNPVVINAAPTVPTASITPATATICSGSSQPLTASGGGTYLWSTGATTAAITVTPIATTTYTVTVTSAGGCTAQASSPVTVTSLPTVSYTQVAPTCTGATTNNNGTISLATATNGTHFGVSTINAASYNGPTTVATATALGALPTVVKSAIPNAGGTYIIRVFNGSDGCYTDQTVTVSTVTCTCPIPNCGTATIIKN